MRLLWLVLVLTAGSTATLLVGCATQSPAASGTAAGRNISPDVRAALAYLAKGHSDKTKLAFLADFKGLTDSVAAFNRYMNSSQAKLLLQLNHWATAHHVDLTMIRVATPLAVAEHRQEGADGDVLLHAGGGTFQHYYLLYMYLDFDSTLQIDKTLMGLSELQSHPHLRAYLQAASAVSEHSLKEIRQLLKRYKWPGH